MDAEVLRKQEYVLTDVSTARAALMRGIIIALPISIVLWAIVIIIMYWVCEWIK